MFFHRLFKKVEVPRMPVEDLIQKLLSSRPDIKYEELRKMIEAKVEESKGFLTHESATRAVATELGVETLKIPPMRGIMIKDLVSGLGDVTITARVIFVGPLQKFTSPDGREGRMRHLVAADMTGELRVVLWDNKADMASSSSLLGQIVQFTHGYMRSRFDGKLELSIGSKGTFRTASSEMSAGEIPSLAKFHRKIKEITKGVRTANVVGSVAEVYPASTFSREDGSEGMLKKLELQDETGTISIVLWNTKVQELSDITVGSLLQVFGGKIKESLNEGVELHVDSSVGIAVLRELPTGI
jgi:replication factor A1